MSKPKILFIAHHRENRSPGQRFRFEQYLKHLQLNGFEVEISPLLDEWDDKNFYKKGLTFAKFIILFKILFRRLRDVFRAKNFDIIFIRKEAFVTGSTFFEKAFKRSGSKLIFDFDDSIWLDNVSEGNKSLAFLKNASKTSDIIALCDLIIAGNEYLADYARQYNKNVTIFPTTIDTEEYKPVPPTTKPDDSITIGWSGSITTIQHFKHALPFLEILKQKYGNKINISVIGDGNYKDEKLGIVGKPWRKDTELTDLCAFDIGIMPLPDDKWSRGKCGLKGLQYMALAIPTLMSPVGVNKVIIQDGVNGYLATEVDEWVEKITRLIEDKELRLKLGQAARQTVLDKYSVVANQDNYVAIMKGLIKAK